MIVIGGPDLLRLRQLNARGFEVMQRAADNVAALLGVTKEMIPKVILCQEAGVADDDLAKAGPR